MCPQSPAGAPVWLRAALWLTTTPVRRRMVAGWSLRTAGPKWACVWRNHPEAQCRLRTIVMPAPWNGWCDPAWQALLHQRLHEIGLEPDGPDPRLLAQAERETFARLAPPWTKRMMEQYK